MKYYMRKLSTVIRIFSRKDHVDEDAEFTPLTEVNRILTIIACRFRNRLFQQAWNRWLSVYNINHNYTNDVRNIFYRFIPDNVERTETEIAIIYKWIEQYHHVDATGLACTVISCTRCSVIARALQRCRLEIYRSGDPIIDEGDAPKSEEGQFTILSGECEVTKIPPEVLAGQQVHQSEDGLRGLLGYAKVIHVLKSPAGFGELATLEKFKRSVTVRASTATTQDVVLIVIPDDVLLALLSASDIGDVLPVDHPALVRRQSSLSSISFTEALEFFRLTGLDRGVSPGQILWVAKHMKKRVFQKGNILYIKGEPATTVFVMMFGEALLDISDPVRDTSGEYVPFLHAVEEYSYLITNSSLLGDEGMSGMHRVYASTAVIVSPVAIIFEFSGSSLDFLSRSMGVERYAALAYRDLPQSDTPLVELNGEVLLHSFFNSLGGAISSKGKYRGISFAPTQPLPVIPEPNQQLGRKGTSKSNDKSSKKQSASTSTASQKIVKLTKPARDIIDLSLVPRQLAMMAEHHVLQLLNEIKKHDKVDVRAAVAASRMSTNCSEEKPKNRYAKEEKRLNAAVARYKNRYAQKKGDLAYNPDEKNLVKRGVTILSLFFKVMMEDVDYVEDALKLAASKDEWEIYAQELEANEKSPIKHHLPFFPTGKMTIAALLTHFPTEIEKFILFLSKEYLELFTNDDGELNVKDISIAHLCEKSSVEESEPSQSHLAIKSSSGFHRLTTSNTRMVMEHSLKVLAHIVIRYKRPRKSRDEHIADVVTAPFCTTPNAQGEKVRLMLEGEVDHADPPITCASPEAPATSGPPAALDKNTLKGSAERVQGSVQSPARNNLSQTSTPAASPTGQREADNESLASASETQSVHEDVTEKTCSESEYSILSDTEKSLHEAAAAHAKHEAALQKKLKSRERKLSLASLPEDIHDSKTTLSTMTKQISMNQKDVLARFDAIMKISDQPSHFQEGKKRAATSSRFRFDSKDSTQEPAYTLHVPSPTGSPLPSVTAMPMPMIDAVSHVFEESQSRKDLRDWQSFVKEQTNKYRETGHVSLPALMRGTAHAAQYGNKVVIHRSVLHADVDHEHLRKVEKKLKNKSRTTLALK